MVSHALNKFCEKHMELIVEAICCKKQSIGIPGEGVSQSCYICIIAVLVQMIIYKSNIETAQS
jgi:hypothetical protein